MHTEQLEHLKKWFDDYVAGFYGRDEYTNANLQLKEEHTRKTCEQMRWLAGEMSLDKNSFLVAETIALLHDIGRFEQFIKYSTYHDGRSINHCLLALDVLERYKVLKDVATDEREIIYDAIKYHGDKELPGDLDGACLLQARLINDSVVDL